MLKRVPFLVTAMRSASPRCVLQNDALLLRSIRNVYTILAHFDQAGQPKETRRFPGVTPPVMLQRSRSTEVYRERPWHQGRPVVDPSGSSSTTPYFKEMKLQTNPDLLVLETDACIFTDAEMAPRPAVPT
jgi:hypothetical protein